MKQYKVTSIIAIISIICSSFIIKRHDVLDIKYLEYGKSTQFQSLAIFELKDGTSIGNGTLISTQWVLTAKHVAVGISQGYPVNINGQKYQVEKIINYPQAEPEDPYAKIDIAMVKLSTPVLNTKPAPIIMSSPQKGDLIHIAGNGGIGNGLNGQSKTRYSDKRIRAATNTIEKVGPLYLEFVFDNPSSGKATKLEGIPGFRDSGGPLYIEKENEFFLAGVSSFQVALNGTQNAHYGVREHYVNVFKFIDWINTLLKGHEYFKTTIDDKSMVAIINDNSIISLSINGETATTEDLDKYTSKIISSYSELSSQSIADKIPIFLDFLKELAIEEKIISKPQNIGFSLNNEQLLINNKKLSPENHIKVLEMYTSLFSHTIAPGETISFNP